MDENVEIHDRLKDLIDDYFSGIIDEDGVHELEKLLSTDVSARNYFVRYGRLNTDLHQVVRAGNASKAVLQALSKTERASAPQTAALPPAGAFVAQPRVESMPRKVWTAIAALILLVALPVALLVFHLSTQGQSAPPIAWVINAQNCVWEQGLLPSADMKAGKILALERGLVEIGFESGAIVVLEGPASLELTSEKSAKLLRGRLTARVPKSARGFSIVSPQGKVVDMGTEFGVSVAHDGATDVYVFKGEVKALAKDDPKSSHEAINITENHGARIEPSGVSLRTVNEDAEAKLFVRQIPVLHTVVPHVMRLDFQHSVPNTLADTAGAGTGFTTRMPGTGASLLSQDVNLKLDTSRQQLELTTTNSDINRRFHLEQGEYLGFHLSELGFTGNEDFSIMVTIPNIPTLKQLGQFGLYAGMRNDRCIRGGLISKDSNGSYTLFMANNNGGDDSNAHFVGVQSSGEDMRMTLHRRSGKYSLTVENLTAGSASSVSIRHPDFLDSERDLFVGLFGANTQSEVRRTLYIKEIVVMVWSDVASPSPVATNP